MNGALRVRIKDSYKGRIVLKNNGLGIAWGVVKVRQETIPPVRAMGAFCWVCSFCGCRGRVGTLAFLGLAGREKDRNLKLTKTSLGNILGSYILGVAYRHPLQVVVDALAHHRLTLQRVQ